jgi:hypothetical protein
MGAASTSETSVNFYQTTRQNNTEHSYLHTRRRENLKSHKLKNVPIKLTSDELNKLYFIFITSVIFENDDHKILHRISWIFFYNVCFHFLKVCDNMWFMKLIPCWTLPIVWGHDVSGIGSTTIFRCLVVTLMTGCIPFVINIIGGEGWDRNRDLLNTRLLHIDVHYLVVTSSTNIIPPESHVI